MRPAHQTALSATVALATALLLAGCVYRADTQQGNLLNDEQVQQIEVGMTRSQVRFIMGTPMVADPFSRDRWDYKYFYRIGRSGKVRESHVVVYFEGDLVTRIDRPPPAPAPEAKDGSAATG